MSTTLTFVCCCVFFVSAQITQEGINDMRSAIRQEIDTSGNNRRLLAPIVRLIFHDCAGPSSTPGLPSQCNGCIDLANSDHDGLQQSAIAPLEPIFREFNQEYGINRADFWAFAATVAIQYAKELDTSHPGDTLPPIPYYFGRETCSESPDSSITKSFVDASWGWEDVYEWFDEHMDFSPVETVAIIGAHTLGKAHVQFSGHSSVRWKRRGPDQLNNEYYENLFRFRWNHVQSPRGLWEWRTLDRGRDILMLNSDQSLVKDIDGEVDLANQGRVACARSGCDNSPVRSIAADFANDNQLWLNEFSAAFEKLITTGYDGSGLSVF